MALASRPCVFGSVATMARTTVISAISATLEFMGQAKNANRPIPCQRGQCLCKNNRDNLSPINRHNLARVEYERAVRYFEEGDAERAQRHIDESLRHNQLDNDALRLRDQIAAALNDKNWFKNLRRKPPTELHRVPSAPALQSNGAVFEFEQEVLDSGSKPLAPVGR